LSVEELQVTLTCELLIAAAATPEGGDGAAVSLAADVTVIVNGTSELDDAPSLTLITMFS
jgi:hypothetical protein